MESAITDTPAVVHGRAASVQLTEGVRQVQQLAVLVCTWQVQYEEDDNGKPVDAENE